MELILTHLTTDEFFEYGGVVYLLDGGTITDAREFDENFYKENEENNRPIGDIEVCTIGSRRYIYDASEWEFNYSDMKNYLSPKDAYGIQNVNFSQVRPDDERWEEYKKQREENGFDISETWSLDSTIIKFILPRLKAFYNDGNVNGHPVNTTEEGWKVIIKKMIRGFEQALIHNTTNMCESPDVKEGLDLFREYFFSLWW